MASRPGRVRRQVIIAVVLLLVVNGVVSYVRYVIRGVENAYAVWNVADMIVIHLETHSGRWPSGWDELQVAARVWSRHDDTDIGFWRDRVDVDFNADPKQLAAAPFDPQREERPFNVVRSRRAPRAYYTEPNVRIWSYLTGKRPATGPTTRLAPS
jgi:hypothetical protein